MDGPILCPEIPACSAKIFDPSAQPAPKGYVYFSRMLRHEHLDDRSMQEILARAAEIDGNADYDLEILEKTAAELGISAQAVRQAREEHKRGAEERRLREQFRLERAAGFRNHLVPYVVVNIFLHAINFITDRGDYWAIFPLLGWGIGLAIHGFHALGKSGPAFEADFRAWLAEKRKAASVLLPPDR